MPGADAGEGKRRVSGTTASSRTTVPLPQAELGPPSLVVVAGAPPVARVQAGLAMMAGEVDLTEDAVCAMLQRHRPRTGT